MRRSSKASARSFGSPAGRIRSRLLGPVFVLGCAAAAFGGNALPLSPCRVPGIDREVRCGTYPVFEDRTARKGRKIGLNVLVLPATGARRLPDPLFWFDGGPGEAATNNAAIDAREFATLNIDRDIVLVDVRGTGKSNGLPCFGTTDLDVQGMLDGFIPVEKIPACRERLEKHADLALYTTSLAVDDVDEVREALGYPRVNLIGGSYGTRAVLAFLRQHGGHVRSAVLWDVCPTGLVMPLTFARDTQASIDGLWAACAGDASCRAAFPDPAADLAGALRDLQAHSVHVEAVDPQSRKRASVTMTRDGFAQTVRSMLYSPKSASRVLLEVHAAAAGNFEPIASTALAYGKSILGSIDDGDYLSITCSEDVPFYTEAEGEAAARGTFLGDFRVRVQKEACRLWPTRPVARSFLEPVRSSVPVLLIGGDLDPVNPPRTSDEAMRTLPHAARVLVRRGSHDFEGMGDAGCIDRIITTFVAAGSEENLDTRCVAAMHPVPFALR